MGYKQVFEFIVGRSLAVYGIKQNYKKQKAIFTAVNMA